MFTRQKLDIGMVNFHLKLLRVAPFLLGGFMVLNGILTIFYLQQSYALSRESGLIIALLILAMMITLGLLFQVGVCLAMSRVHQSFKVKLESYVDFLLDFEETPRSKFAKKYMPPMDVLREEHSSMYNSTVRSNSSMFVNHKFI